MAAENDVVITAWNNVMAGPDMVSSLLRSAG